MKIGFCYSAEKVSAHFVSYDRNQDGLLSRNEYILTLREDDAEYEVSDEEEYYRDLTDLLYEQYDIDGDENIDMREWH